MTYDNPQLANTYLAAFQACAVGLSNCAVQDPLAASAHSLLCHDPDSTAALLQATDDPQYAWVARGVLDYMMRDMTHPEGGIFSAEVPIPPRCAGCADGLQYVIPAVRIIGLCQCKQCQQRLCNARSAGCRQPGSSDQLQEGGRLLPVV